MNHEFFENGTSLLQRDTSNSLLPLTMTTQQLLLSIPRPNMELSSCNVRPLFQGGREWNVELRTNGADIPVPSLPGYQTPNSACHVLSSSTAAGRASPSTSHELDTMEPSAAVERSSKQRCIMPKSMNTTSETIRVAGGKNALVQATKRAGRRGPLPEKKKDKISRMRDKTACAACFASHVEVSCHRCDCRKICLTVTKVL
jgi:hypothetical protein